MRNPMKSVRLAVALGAAAFMFAGLAVTAAGQTADNDLFTSNGAEAILAPEPSVGTATGVLPPDWAGGNYFFNLLHADRLHHATGSMTLTSLEFRLSDSNWTTSPVFYDMALTETDVSGNLPDSADPGVVYISLGASGLTNPCLLPGDPFGCAGADCVAQGAGIPVDIQVQFPGGGLSVTADGATNSALSLFQPGGMVTGPAEPPGCVLGDYMLMPHLSASLPPSTAGEHVSSTIPDRYSGVQFGGIGIGNLGGDQAFDVTFGFDEPTLNLRVVPFDEVAGAPAAPESGLASHHLRVDSGLTSLGVEMHSLDGIGNTAIIAASLSTLSLPGAPVGPVGTKLMLTPDALFNLVLGAGAYLGPIVLAPNGGAPLDDGVFQSGLLSVPASVPDGIELFFQGFELDGSNDPVASTNVAKITLWTSWPAPPPATVTSGAAEPVAVPGASLPLSPVSIAERTRILDQWTEVGADGVTRMMQSRIAVLMTADGQVEEVPVRLVATPHPEARVMALDPESVLVRSGSR